MTIADFNADRPQHLTTVLTRVAGPYQAGPNDGAILARRLPPPSNAGQAGTRATAGALRALDAWTNSDTLKAAELFLKSGMSADSRDKTCQQQATARIARRGLVRARVLLRRHETPLSDAMPRTLNIQTRSKYATVVDDQLSRDAAVSLHPHVCN